MKVCCISAKAQHGKDTAAELMESFLTFIGKRVLVIHYADLLKFICTKFFGWDGTKDEKGRTILQHIGTDVVGAKKPDYWVDWVVNFLKLFEEEWDFVLIPDCRYPIEYSKVADAFDTVLLRIERPNFDNKLSLEQKQHPSEVSMDEYHFDNIILNDGTVDDLRDRVIEFIYAKMLD
jgi:hypothetical protein